MSKFKESVLGTVLILAAVCFITVFGLAATNDVTAPLIKEAEELAAQNGRFEVLPKADDFKELAVPESGGKTATNEAIVLQAFEAINGEGYVFLVSNEGFGGEMRFMVGIDKTGEYTGITVLEQQETPGLGSNVTDPEYLARFSGLTTPVGVDGQTSATVTSDTLKEALIKASLVFGEFSGIETVDAETTATGVAGETDADTSATAEAEDTTDADTEATAEAEDTTDADTEATAEAEDATDADTSATAEAEDTADAETEATAEADDSKTIDETNEKKSQEGS